MTVQNRKFILINVLLELVLLNFCISLILFLLTYYPISNLEVKGQYFSSLAILNICWLLVLYIHGNEDHYINPKFQRRNFYIFLNILLFIGIAYFLGHILKITFLMESAFLFAVLLFGFLDVFIFKIFLGHLRRAKKKKYGPRVLLIGNERHRSVTNTFGSKSRFSSYETVGILDNNGISNKLGKRRNGHSSRVIGRVNDLSHVLDTTQVDEIFVNIASLKEKELDKVIKTADFHGVRISLIPNTPSVDGKNLTAVSMGEYPVFKLRQSPLDSFNNYLLKKIFDFVFALSVIIILSPLYLLISFLLFLDFRGTILYTPIRKGENGKAFRCYKFRTMKDCDDPLNGNKSTKKNDPRVTKVGKYLRKYDLDELPQFFNVLMGDMSVVGPRPHRIYLHNDFRKIVNDYMVRHYVKPGITGWAQVNGWRGPAMTKEQKEQRVRHDLWYIENWSFWLDIEIIFRTVFSKKTRKNAF